MDMLIPITPTIIIALISLVIELLAFIITFRQYITDRHTYVGFMSITWACSAGVNLLQVLGNAFLSTTFIRGSLLLYIPLGFSIIFLLDSLSRESTDVRKFGIVSFLSAVILIYDFNPSQVYVQGSRVLLGAELGLSYFVLTVFEGIWWVYYVLRIFKNAPKALKRGTILLVISSILMGIITILVLVSGLDFVVPGIGFIVHGIGTLLFTIAFTMQPRLGYVLPFRAIRLTILETRGGIPLFTHTWSQQDQLMNDTIFSGMLHGISTLLNEALHRGNLREISVDNAILIVKRSEEYPIACILVASRASPSLRAAIDAFLNKFTTHFHQYFGNAAEIGRFAQAESLITECFNFVPNYD